MDIEVTSFQQMDQLKCWNVRTTLSASMQLEFMRDHAQFTRLNKVAVRDTNLVQLPVR